MIGVAMGLLPGRASPQEPSAFAALEWPGDLRDLPGAAGALWPWLFAAAAAVVLVAMHWRRSRGLAMSSGVGAAPAGTALARLRALGLPGDPLEYPAFCESLKGLVRLHCRERFGLRAEQATSEELVLALPQPAELRHCLQACDLVLFAARAGTAPELAAGRNAAIAFTAATSSGEVA